MRLTLKKIAEMSNGQVRGDPERVITGVASLSSAGAGDISFLRDLKALQAALESKAGAILVKSPCDDIKTDQVITANPSMAFAAIATIVAGERFRRSPGIHATALIAGSARIGRDCSIGPGCVVEDGAEIGDRAALYPNVFIGRGSRIGECSLIYPNVTVREDTLIGKRCIIHSNTSIGDDGFGFVNEGGRFLKLPQLGAVKIGDDAEIGACCTVARGALDDTEIGNGVKIDNHCHVAHNCRIGDDTMLVGYTKLAGSVTIGRNCMLAGDVDVVDHVKIGDRCIVAAGSGVAKNLPDGSVVFGRPAYPIDEARRLLALIRRLPEMREQLRDAARRLKALEVLSPKPEGEQDAKPSAE
ncbi:MAG TPA: UDP-3-O-(3-hydroxymyristoyl)glucosamine N-acyltransferase [Candidatus Brocadiia bacterium]|nr:UDP-3-O-(3-hydroxymyristoyl)glucosamine N-acyltransferase [Candidatus Brocadiia bacterium]